MRNNDKLDHQNDWNLNNTKIALQNCEIISQQIILFLKDYLSEFHNTKFSLKNINLLLGNWVNYYSQVIYDRYETIKKLKDKKQDLKENFDLQPPVFDTTEFNQKCSLSESYNNYLYQLISEVEYNLFEKKKLKSFIIK